MPLLGVGVLYPFLFPVYLLGQVVTRLILVFEVEDHCYAFVFSGCFGSVKSSGAVVSVFIIFDHFLGIAHFRVVDPRIVFVHPSFPLDKVINDFVGFLALSTADRAGSRVQDLFDFKFLLIIDEVGRRWRQYFLIREGQRDVRGEQLLVEAQVNLPVCGELKLISSCSDLFKDREGADVLVVELLLGSWKVEVGGVQPDLVADLVVARCRLLLVILSLHVARSLLKRVAGFTMNIAHRRHEFFCRWIGDGVVVRGVRDETRVLAVENHERALPGSAVDPVVMCELCEWQPVGPVVLSIVNEDSEVFLDFLVNSFGLTIRLRMEGG